MENNFTFYWTPNGKRYHIMPECDTLLHSRTILYGTLAQARSSGHGTICSSCALYLARHPKIMYASGLDLDDEFALKYGAALCARVALDHEFFTEQPPEERDSCVRQFYPDPTSEKFKCLAEYDRIFTGGVLDLAAPFVSVTMLQRPLPPPPGGLQPPPTPSFPLVPNMADVYFAPDEILQQDFSSGDPSLIYLKPTISPAPPVLLVDPPASPSPPQSPPLPPSPAPPAVVDRPRRPFWSILGGLFCVLCLFFAFFYFIRRSSSPPVQTSSSSSSVPSSSRSSFSTDTTDWDDDNTTCEVVGRLDNTVYWTAGGKSYHFSATCLALSRSKEIFYSTLTKAFRSGYTDPCDICVLSIAPENLDAHYHPFPGDKEDVFTLSTSETVSDSFPTDISAEPPLFFWNHPSSHYHRSRFCPYLDTTLLVYTGSLEEAELIQLTACPYCA